MGRIVASLSSLVAGLALAACSAAGPVEPLTVADVSSETWLTITDEGAGAVRSGTPYREARLAGVAEGAEIRPIQTAREESTTWTHAAFIDDIQAVQFFKGRGNTVAEIHGVGENLTGPNGERIGMTMRQAGVARRHCRNGRALWRGMAICRARGARNVKLVFSIPGYEGPFDRLPSARDLKRARLQRIVWQADT
jgi:hypothetical protein